MRHGVLLHSTEEITLMRRLVIVLLLADAAFALEFHVAPSGKASNPGTAEAPLATLAQARDATRAAKQAGTPLTGGVTVWIHAGRYPMTTGLVLAAEDGGAAEWPVVYRALPGHEVRLVGGVELGAAAFQPVAQPESLERIDPAAREAVRVADLKALAVPYSADFPDLFDTPPVVSELFLDDVRMTLARWPNNAWAEVARVIESGPAPWRNHPSDKPGTFEYAGDRPSRWVNAPAVWLHGYWCFDWRCETIRAGTIDPAKRQITFVKPHCYGLGHGNPAARRYFAVNLLEELDEPGEYFLDAPSGLLYFWPPTLSPGSHIVLSTLTTPLLELEGASCITIRGIIVEACAGVGIRVADGRENRIVDCLIRNTGRDGIIVDGGEEHRVIACTIRDTGTAGLRMGGGDRPSLRPCGHEALHNHIHHVSRRQRTAAYHIHLSGVGVRVAHNLLHDAPHQAIGLQGNDHVIEYNEIHHTGMETDDCGAFYMGRNPSERGTIIRYNFWHHIGSSLTHGSCAVYFDDGSGGQTVFGNVFYQAAGGHFGAVFVHGGHDNIVENNIFVDCKLAFSQAPWSDEHWLKELDSEPWQRKLRQEVDITRPPYRDRYPGLEGFLDFAGEPRFNHARRNVVVQCDAFVDGNWTLLDNFVTDTDPGFVDRDAMNFRLRGQSVVFRRVPGFQPIPFERIGPHREEILSE